jgi:hypothetical protein
LLNLLLGGNDEGGRDLVADDWKDGGRVLLKACWDEIFS